MKFDIWNLLLGITFPAKPKKENLVNSDHGPLTITFPAIPKKENLLQILPWTMVKTSPKPALDHGPGSVFWSKIYFLRSFGLWSFHSDWTMDHGTFITLVDDHNASFHGYLDRYRFKP
jgi:hypothetical protein